MIESWAKFCAQFRVSFPMFNRGVDLLMERDGFWADRGFAAVLRTLEAGA